MPVIRKCSDQDIKYRNAWTPETDQDTGKFVFWPKVSTRLISSNRTGTLTQMIRRSGTKGRGSAAYLYEMRGDKRDTGAGGKLDRKTMNNINTYQNKAVYRKHTKLTRQRQN